MTTPVTSTGYDDLPRVLTCDLWFTVVYVRAGERRRIEAERRRTWLKALRRTGVGSPRARALWEEERRWVLRMEWAGQAPSIPAQAEWFGRRLARPLDAARISGALAEGLRNADVRLAPGSAAALDVVASTGSPIGLISNVCNESGEATRDLLERLGLRDRFASIQLSCELPWSKPHPGPFYRCLEELGAAPDQAVHLGDHPVDIVGAHRAGIEAWRFVGFSERRPDPYPDRARPSRNSEVPRIASWAEVSDRWTNGAATA